MKKIHLLLLSFVFLCPLCTYADSPCSSEIQPESACSKSYQKPCHKHKKQDNTVKCPQTYTKHCVSECFLCTNANMNNLFKQTGLSETQICTAMKIQDKYELEVLSINERIKCEDANLNSLKKNCAKRSQLREQNRLINKLKKERKEICKCYEKQFKALLSDRQKRAYKKYKKCSR